MLVYAEAIPHKAQRYETVGDWQLLPGGIHVSVSDTHSKLSNQLVALHEIVEAILCEAKGVSQEDVDRFDMAYERARKDGDTSEPGDHPGAPYHEQHVVADLVERLVAFHAGVSWFEHEQRVSELGR